MSKVGNRKKKLRGRILFLSLFLILVSLMVVLGYFFGQKKKMEDELQSAKRQNSELSQRVDFFETQIQLDSLLIQGQYEEAVEGYRQELEEAGSITKPFAEVRLQVAKQLLQTQQQKNTAQHYNMELRETEEKLQELQDSLMLFAVKKTRERDSLAWEISSSMQKLRKLQSELAQKEAHDFLNFTSAKGNEVFYIGKVEDGKANGEGIGIWLTGSKYEGEWKDNKRHGEGVFRWADGERYEGEYRNDMRHGKGTYYWTNGQKYVGEWEQDQRSGQGVFYDEDGNVLAQGEWQNDELVQTEEP